MGSDDSDENGDGDNDDNDDDDAKDNNKDNDGDGNGNDNDNGGSGGSRGSGKDDLNIISIFRFQLQHLLFFLPLDFFKLIVSFCGSFCALRNLCCRTCRVIAMNISSTLILSLADVSNNSISICWANRWASSVITTFRSGSSFLLPTIFYYLSNNNTK